MRKFLFNHAWILDNLIGIAVLSFILSVVSGEISTELFQKFPHELHNAMSTVFIFSILITLYSLGLLRLKGTKTVGLEFSLALNKAILKVGDNVLVSINKPKKKIVGKVAETNHLNNLIKIVTFSENEILVPIQDIEYLFDRP